MGFCEVDWRIGYFHCWEQYSDVIKPGLTITSSKETYGSQNKHFFL